MNTALHVAASCGHHEFVRFILACGFAADTRNSGGLAAMQVAAQFGELAVIEQLLQFGADIDVMDVCFFTPVMYAALRNQAEVVTLLVDCGASLADGRAVAKAALAGSIDALKALMTSSRWLAMGRTERLQAEGSLLHFVTDTTTMNALRSLVLDMSALVQYQDTDGDNALHDAAHEGKPVPLICALIKEGVDPAAMNSAGQTPADLAREAGHTLQATLLDRAAEDKRKRDLQQQQQQQTATITE